VDGDARGFRVALVADEFVNPATGGLDALAVLEAADWGAIQLPAADYPNAVAEPLLDQVAEQAEEFHRHGYRLAVIGSREGLEDALRSHGVPPPPHIQPADAEALREFLDAAGA